MSDLIYIINSVDKIKIILLNSPTVSLETNPFISNSNL